MSSQQQDVGRTSPTQQDLLRVVAVVGSAGGVEAITAVLEDLPRDFPAAIIVVLHRRPGDDDLLTPILARRCALDVVQARDGMTLHRGTVVVIPPGWHGLVGNDDRVILIPSNEPPPYRPSADLLLASLALSAGIRTVAVVLSGLGHDGATGAEVVHHEGGMVIASDEATSTYFSMPKAAIEQGHAVDLVLPLDGIAPALVTLVGDRSEAREASQPA